MSWQCFMLEPTGRARRALRRFTYSEKPCAAHPSYGHDASVPIEDCAISFDDRGIYSYPKDIPHDDRRWPLHCACGYQFVDDDEWQVNAQQLWRAPDGAEYTTHPHRADRAPVGAMWDCVWHHDIPDYCGPDGRSLTLMLPDGFTWLMDGPSRDGGHWTRTGTLPHITVRPSILSPNYHGWLTDGVLSDDLDGRTYGVLP